MEEQNIPQPKGSLVERLKHLTVNEANTGAAVMEQAHDIGLGLQNFPERHALSDVERIVAAAVCVVQAMQGEGPVYYLGGKLRLFKFVNNSRYLMVLKLASLFHATALCALEPPPRLNSATDEEISKAGFFPDFPRAVDAAICCLYVLNCVMIHLTNKSILSSHKNKTKNKSKFALTHVGVMNILVGLLTIDMLVTNVGGRTTRPFRCLRPGMYVLLSPLLRTMARSCAATFPPLLKTFFILVAAQLFYATIGLNLFHGSANDQNPFGAACLEESASLHPFADFGWSYVTMYIASTGDNHPMVIWPFFTCECSVQVLPSGNTTTVPYLWSTGELPWCQSRRTLSILFFMSFMAIVFFCLGNCILAVCYFFFQDISKNNVTTSMMRQRASLLTALYYLDTTSQGLVNKQDFVAVCQEIKSLSHHKVPAPDKLFDYLDSAKTGSIGIAAMFRLPDLIQTRLIMHREDHNEGWYNRRWKHSKLRKMLADGLHVKVFRMPVVDLLVSLLLFITLVMYMIDGVRDSDWVGAISDYVIVVFVIEVIWRLLAEGFKTYWLDNWNRFDLLITICSIVFFFYQHMLASQTIDDGESHRSALPAFQCVRLLRTIRLVRLTMGKGGAHSDGDADPQAQAQVQVESLEMKDVTPESTPSVKPPPHPKKESMLERNRKYYKKIITSLATTIPVCIDILVLLFLYMSTFALVGMELMSSYDNNTKLLFSGNAVVNFISNSQFKVDWGDWVASMISVMVIMVGNTWSSLLIEAMVRKGFSICVFIITFHFLGRFLILNVIQSLFVSAFSTLLNDEAYNQTVEASMNDYTTNMVKDPRVKQVSRAPRLEYLMLTANGLEDMFRNWRKKHTGNGIQIGQTNYELPFSPKAAAAEGEAQDSQDKKKSKDKKKKEKKDKRGVETELEKDTEKDKKVKKQKQPAAEGPAESPAKTTSDKERKRDSKRKAANAND